MDMKKRCAHCGTAEGKLRRCAKCENAHYCGKECQLAAWAARPHTAPLVDSS